MPECPYSGRAVCTSPASYVKSSPSLSLAAPSIFQLPDICLSLWCKIVTPVFNELFSDFLTELAIKCQLLVHIFCSFYCCTYLSFVDLWRFLMFCGKQSFVSFMHLKYLLTVSQLLVNLFLQIARLTTWFFFFFLGVRVSKSIYCTLILKKHFYLTC